MPDRMRDWELTKRGQAFADRIEKEYRERARENLLALRSEERSRLVEALALIESLLARG